MEVTFSKKTDEHAIFELKGVDVPFANALRRIMIAEVATMAIEYVQVVTNDSTLHDSVLAHRLGLVPIFADPSMYESCLDVTDLQDDKNCIRFSLEVTAERSNVKSDGSVHVLSKDLRYVARGEGGASEPRLVHEDIMLAKLNPGEQIKLECFAVKGTGGDHAKFSPVGTASYRATPWVKLVSPVKDEKHIKQLKKLCARKVFDIEDGELLVKNAGACSMCRECVRDTPFQDNIELGRVPNSFIFSVESTGILSATEIFQRAILVLKRKCETVAEAI